ncbi:GDA1/CD39 nucleoside phosphatase family protein [Striga asiatica]|uniref:GDA1/CD39 nucleoside phosphatase family protein n=1 Tax=Striga asiatica TaxID=4170 RepID=A0A5A7QKG7_STRAF|nr:GDA1/CD39 nucleoside phosphatase family protein [Striga asiatica]
MFRGPRTCVLVDSARDIPILSNNGNERYGAVPRQRSFPSLQSLLTYLASLTRPTPNAACLLLENASTPIAYIKAFSLISTVYFLLYEQTTTDIHSAPHQQAVIFFTLIQKDMPASAVAGPHIWHKGWGGGGYRLYQWTDKPTLEVLLPSSYNACVSERSRIILNLSTTPRPYLHY